jgi:hypothetical protein
MGHPEGERLAAKLVLTPASARRSPFVIRFAGSLVIMVAARHRERAPPVQGAHFAPSRFRLLLPLTVAR